MTPTSETQPSAGPISTGESQELRTRVGRYVLLEFVGAGGMGIVYRAYDPKLRREVAIKRLRGPRRNEEDLLREARAMAAISHPNVLPIYDVGENPGFLAMEYVEGSTLARWLRESPRSQHEILGAFLKAGDGLAEAHRCGLIHRDFKPANVMIGADGRVRVMDFGLVRHTNQKLEETAEQSGSDSRLAYPGQTRAQPLTDGHLAGTLFYMAPEAREGKGQSPLSDQFSFCLSLRTALREEWDAQPNVGTSTAVNPGLSTGPRRESAASPQTSYRDVDAALERGLCESPSERWPDMDSLLDSLRARPRGRKWIAGAGVTATALTLGTLGASSQEPVDPCINSDTAIEGVWDEKRRSDVKAGFLALDKSFADEAWVLVEPKLTAYTEAWVRSKTKTCRFAQQADTPPAVAQEQAMCLRQQLGAVDALIDEFARADARVATRAAGAAGRLPIPATCEEQVTRGGFVAPPDPMLASELEAFEQQLARHSGLVSSGQLRKASEMHKSLIDAAEATEYPRAIARAQMLAGSADAKLDRQEEERDHYDAGLQASIRSGDVLIQSGIMNLLCVFHAQKMDNVDTALTFCAGSDAALDRAGRPPAYVVKQMTAAAIAHRFAGNLPEALRLAREAVKLSEAEEEARYRWPSAQATLAALLGISGDYEEAAEVTQETLAWAESNLGSHDPTRLQLLSNHVGIAAKLGDLSEARAAAQEAIALRTEVYGANSTKVAKSHNMLSFVESSAGNFEAALREAEHTLRIYRDIAPDRHRNIAASEDLVATCLLGLAGREDEALAHSEEAILAWNKTSAANTQRAILHGLANKLQAQLQLGHEIDLAPLDAALKKLPEFTDEAGRLAAFEFIAARALEERRGARGRARELVVSALGRLKESPSAWSQDNVEDMEGWLRSHPLSDQPQ